MSDAYRMNTTNCILVKDDIGRAKKSCYSLPADGHAYGKCEASDVEGAREVVMQWVTHRPRPRPQSDQQDIRKLNKMAAKENVRSAKELAHFRKSHDVRVGQTGPMGLAPAVIPSDVIPAFAYGRKSRPSTPIGAVISHQYAQEQEDFLSGKYRDYDEERDKAHGRIRVQLTKSANQRINVNRGAGPQMLADVVENPDHKNLFKLSKFQKATGGAGGKTAPAGMSKQPAEPAMVQDLAAPQFEAGTSPAEIAA
mmetsp:Transcript_42272/g.95105  ORF Transcript_42272/g.95105 Transcript_42272/m.95105 type:complete len:253 (+) Transcript_42272:117-875(+)